MAQRLPQSFLVFVLLIGALEGGVLFNSCHLSPRPSRLRDGGRPLTSELEVPATVLAIEDAATTSLIRTERRNYRPGQTVTVTGSGWQPGETVSLFLDQPSTAEPGQAFFVTADSAGNIFHNQSSPDVRDSDVTFLLTATGQSSGARTQTRFTNHPVTNSRAAVPPTDGVVTRWNTFSCP